MKTQRERAVELHNAGVDKAAICREVGLTSNELETKLSQSRRAGVPVRPDGMSVDDFKKQFPRAASASDSELAKAVAKSEAPRKDTTPDAVRAPKPLDYCELVKAWNQNPDIRAISRQFGLKPPALARTINRLRVAGVLLKYSNQISNLAAVRAAAESALSPQEAAELRNRIANRKKATVHKLKHDHEGAQHQA